MANIEKNKKFFLYLLLAVLTILLLGWFFSSILLYFAISFIFATILRPLNNYISYTQIFNIKIPKVVAVIISFTFLMVGLSLFILLFIPLVTEQIQILINLDYDELYVKLTSPLSAVENFMIKYRLTQSGEGFIVDNLRDNLISLFTQVNLNTIFSNIISFTGSFFIGTIAVIFITFFLLYEKGIIRKQFIALIPNQYFEMSIGAIYKTEKLLSNYLLGLLFQMFAIFSIASFGLSMLGIKYALTIAVFAAVANLIPYAGPILGAVFGIIVGLSTSNFAVLNNEYIFLVLKIVSVFVIVQLIDNLILQPLIFSKSVKAHPLEIFVVIFAGATIAGILGMIVAIPVYTVIRVSIKELYEGYRHYHIFKT